MIANVNGTGGGCAQPVKVIGVPVVDFVRALALRDKYKHARLGFPAIAWNARLRKFQKVAAVQPKVWRLIVVRACEESEMLRTIALKG